MPLSDSDPRLARARRGDMNALSGVLAELTPALTRMAELRLDRALGSRVDPADLVQDALVEATRRFGEWCEQDRYPFRVWLRLLAAQSVAGAVRRHIAAQMRSAAREQTFDARSDADSAPDYRAGAGGWLTTSQTSPTQAAQRTELRERVLAAMEELDELDREILAMRAFEQLTNEEAARELGIETSAASKRFTRALTRLRPALSAFEPSGVLVLR